jgi:hypothetical protein
MFVVGLGHYEHIKWSLSSGVITLFWLSTLLADGVRLRTMALRFEVRCCFCDA